MDDPGPQKPPESPLVPETADRLLSKYVAVWIWTIFFGANSGLTYSYLSFYQASQWQQASQWSRSGISQVPDLLMTVGPYAYGLGTAASIAVWVLLYLFFSIYLLPVVFVGVTAVSEERRRRDGATFLKRTYLLLLLAGVARLTPELLAFAATALLK